ncbi:MAG: dihydropteroate synthase, partial [Planctomycetes bacterium]|nr:dihydropteroate synthase [Planctomycetota bacterium]
LLPVAREWQCPVVALAMDSSGIPADIERRVGVCEAILAAAARAGVAEEKIFFDPLVLPLSADVSTTALTLETLREIKRRHPAARTTLGLSNVSHGLPSRRLVNGAFLIAALAAGLDSAICDPTQPQIRQAIVLGELIAGKDRLCRRFVRQVRKREL